MPSIRAMVMLLLALLLAGCASTPKPPPPFVVTLEPTPPAGDGPHMLVLPVRVVDVRDVPNPVRIGETCAPGAAPPVGAGTREGAAATAALQLLLLTSPQPTGRFLVVSDSEDVARAIEHALTYALLRAKRHPLERAVLEATVRTFWMRASWTTTCDVVVDVRLLASSGSPLWQRTLEGHADKFEGWFTTEAFERVARIALDQLHENAADVFSSAEFGAAVASGR